MMPPSPRRNRALRFAALAALLGALSLRIPVVAADPPVAAPLVSNAPSAKALRDRLAALAASGSKLPDGVHESLAYQVDVAERIAHDFAPQSDLWRARAGRMIDAASQGKDPFLEARGQILMRGYQSPISRVRQGYAIALPKDYDPTRAYPLMIVLHGGSANGNLFLGVVLGNNMNWKEYDKHLWDEFTPRYPSPFIMVAPDGFGQVMWRFMGEQDVLDVIADVQKHYKVDEDRVVLAGLSNGGVGAYTLGMRYASRFSAVLAIAGAPSWLSYAGGTTDPLQAEELEPLSAMTLAENAIDTDFRYFHGHVDPGPMRPAFVEAFGKQIAKLGVPYKEKWFDAGHDLLYLVMRHGLVFDELAKLTRNRHPKEVRIVTGDYRANRQHWVTVTGIERYPKLARVRAVVDGTRLRVETANTLAFTLDLNDAPLPTSGSVSLEVDGQVVFDGARDQLGAKVSLAHEAAGHWRRGELADASDPFVKKPGSAGPITDAYFRPLVHVYGTAIPEQTEALRKTAERGSRGWPLWLWRVEQPVVADRDVTDELLRTHDVVLYATPGSNTLLSKIEAKLPIKIDAQGVALGSQRYEGKGVGTKFVYPNPLAPGRYVIVQAAPTLEGVSGGHDLPDFLPDYVVYDARTTAVRTRLLFDPRRPALALGVFDRKWQLDPTHTQKAMQPTAAERRAARVAAPELNDGNDPESAGKDVPRSRMKVPPAPPAPALPTTFATDAASATGKVVREIARRVQTFTNYRAKIPGASWSETESTWSIREAEACLAHLTELGVQAKPWTTPLATPVAVPVRVTAPVDGVTFRMMHAGAGGVISCELAARLPEIAHIVKNHGVHTVWVLSAYRDHPYTSFHTLGLALDLARFDTEHASYLVKTDFIIDHEHETCAGPEPANEKARVLRTIACELSATRHFSSVLTPNYNVGHRDHFHLDVRPDDTRAFLR